MERKQYILIGSRIRILDGSSAAGDSIDLRYNKKFPEFTASSVASHWQTEKQDIIIGLACQPYVNRIKTARDAYLAAEASLEEIKRNTPVDDTLRYGLTNVNENLNRITRSRLYGSSTSLFLAGG